MKKIVKLNRAFKLVQDFKDTGKKIVLAGGCFDILHLGHVKFLKSAKALSDVLILLLESDLAIKKLKGVNRPVNSQQVRAEILASLEPIDVVVCLEGVLSNYDYEKIIKSINPDYIAVTEGDLMIAQKSKLAKIVGAKLKVVQKKISEHSTTKILGYF